jgi:hypothetical protein
MKTKPQIFTVIIAAILLISGLNGFSQRKSSTPVMMPKQSAFSQHKTVNDTLLPGNLPAIHSDTITSYSMLTSDNGGYILGTNGWHDKCKCEEFKVTYNYHIEGAIYWFGFKRADSLGLIKFAIWNMDSLKGTTYSYADTSFLTNQKCPGTLVVALTDSVKNVDTSSYLEQAHVVMFPFPVLIASDYCIGFDMSNIGYDSIALVSTSQGQGGKLQRVWEQWSSDNKWYTLQGAQWDGDTLDVDAMILPVIDNTAGCVENGDYISGMKLSQSYPNPSYDKCTFSYEFLTPPASASIEILDQNGRRVYLNKNISAGKGINTKTIDVSGFANGTYYYILSTDFSRIAKKMTISR